MRLVTLAPPSFTHTHTLSLSLSLTHTLSFPTQVHARDVIDKLVKSNCASSNDFEWVSQLRFYWDKELNDCVVKQVLSVFMYGYEYQGNNGRLVITPLTDRWVTGSNPSNLIHKSS
jgi:hypothetical protein